MTATAPAAHPAVPPLPPVPRSHTTPRLAWPIAVFSGATLLASGALLALQAMLGIGERFLMLVMFAPSVGTVAALLAVPRSCRALAPARAPRRIVGRAWALAVASALAFAAVTAATVAVTGIDWRGGDPFGGWLLALFVVLQFAGAFGEEYGWRGFLQPALETRLPRLTAMIVTGVVWAAWHPLYLVDPLAWVLFAVSCVGLAVLFGAVSVGSRLQRALLAAFLHGAVNLITFVALPAEQHLELWPFLIGPLLLGAIAAIVVIRGPRHSTPSATR